MLHAFYYMESPAGALCGLVTLVSVAVSGKQI
jgi:hypothetical protein